MDAPQNISWRSGTPLRIGEFIADAASNELTRDGVTTRLRPLLMDVLLRLAADAGNVVTRETLLNDVWPRRMVNDEVLSRAIAELRTALNDDPKKPRYIETLPKVGYRMVATCSAVLVSAPEPKMAEASNAANLVSFPRLQESTPDDADKQHNASIAPASPATSSPGVASTRSTWKTIRVPIIGLAALTIFGIYQSRPQTAKPAAAHIDLERQINAAVPFATSPLTESNPRFSPDGKSVTYARNGETSSEIVIQDVASGTQRAFAIPDARLASPVFFPDGKRLAYWLRRATAAEGQPACAIMARDLVSATDSVIVDCQQRPQPVFDVAPDGQSLIYAALPRAEFPLALLQRDLQTQTIRQLTAPAPGEGHDAYPRISLDSKTVAFFRGSQSHVRLWTLALTEADAKPKPATALEGLSYGVTWSTQDGTLLAAADWLGFRALNSVSLAADGKGAAQLAGARGARFPDMHKSGSLVFESATYRADLWLTSAERPGEAAKIVWPSTRYSNQAEFSPDGKSVSFASNRSGGDAIHVAAIGGEARRLPLPDNARYIQPHWSADGSEIFAEQIAITTAKPATQSAVRINVASGKVDVLTHLGTQVNNAVPLSNGREIIYGELADHAMRLYRADIAGGTPKRLPLPIVASFAIVDNDLVYTQPQLTGATRCKLDSMTCAPVKVELDDNTRFDWALGKNVIWHLGRDDARKAALVRVDLESSERRAFDFAPTAAGTNIAVSRDGKSLLVSREAAAVVDLMIAKRLNAP